MNSNFGWLTNDLLIFTNVCCTKIDDNINDKHDINWKMNCNNLLVNYKHKACI